MTKIEIDLNEEQLEKLKQLESNDISAGDAIDMLFELKENILNEIEELDKKISILDKVKESTLDVENKAENLDENFSETDKTYELKVQDLKHKISWARDFFKF